ncbi:MAG: type I DNA topoisomerase [Clostridiales bacterium]|jgi:DNA topoisomerase-1|nr:type I DNA topoisomerase [Clostridiales bacterium]
MPKSYLVIVESPAKAKTIHKYLGTNYKVVASMGHLRDLPKSQLGVDIEHNFEPKYITIRGKGDLLASLKKQAKTADKVFIATDPDREGEAIAWHLSQVLAVPPEKTTRIAFNEITKSAVKNAVQNSRDIDKDLVDAQQARRVLDRVVGYQISPLLWRKIKKGLSAGRVQSVATRLIVQRQREIDAFNPEEYWSIDANLLNSEKAPFVAHFIGSSDGKKIELHNQKDTQNIVDSLAKSAFTIAKVKVGEKKRNPAPPFTTSTLQQDASRKLGFTSKRTMSLAQGLYEGVNVPGRGNLGLITYMRTDSLRISDEALSAVRTMITDKYGKPFLPDTPRVFKTKKSAQDAHEAIRPTDVNITPAEVKDSLDSSSYRLYKLIWERFVASQMESAILDTISADITADSYLFRANGSRVKFQGFMKLYTESSDTETKDEKFLPNLKDGEKLTLKSLNPEQHFTAPPSNYTEASLIKTMEELGIGRPSTYAPTIATIISRGYVTREKRVLYPTELGTIVTEVMEQYFDKIVDVDFTANIEEELDNVEAGEVKWQQVLGDFYPPFEVSLKKAEEEIGEIEIQDEVSDIPCDKCGRMMVYKMGRYGKFLACPGFPECRNAKPITQEAGVDCPKCGAKILVRKSKRGKIFYGCEKYPECDFVTWDMPTGELCKTCGAAVVKKKGKTGEYETCSNKDCPTNKK